MISILTNSWGKVAAGTVIGLAFITAIVGGISVSISNNERVAMGVQSDGVLLAGMSRKEVHDYFAKTAQSRMSRQAVILKDGKKSYSIAPADIHLTANADEAAERAYNVGRNRFPLLNVIEQMRYAVTGVNIPLTADYDENLLKQKLTAVKQQVDTAPQNAEIQMKDKASFSVKPAVNGRTLNLDSIEQEVSPKLHSMKLTAIVNLHPDTQEPPIKTDDLSSMDTVLGSYTTSFYPGDRGRNIAIAASKLQDALIKPEETFSFNNTVGHRTASAGYRDAGVYIDGKLTQDIGGGVCQVSSTLYNAILLAGLTPTMRTPHYYPSSYCPPGLDATVADDLLDFQFKNNLAHNVMLKVILSPTTLTIDVIGTRADLNGQIAKLQWEGSRQQPSVYRLWYQNGQLQQKEFLHTDQYSTHD